MKLRNKKTGDVFDFDSITDLCFGSKIQFQATNMHNKPIYIFNSLAELNDEWEDYEEPKTFWYMTAWGDVNEYSQDQFAIKQKQEIGNYFETKEEAENAVEKLKAWKRLKDEGISLKLDTFRSCIDYKFDLRTLKDEELAQLIKDLTLLFGGEE